MRRKIAFITAITAVLIVLALVFISCGAAFAVPDDAKDMDVGTWTGTQSGGHRWIELGGILWRVLEVYEYEEDTNNDPGNDSSIDPDSVTPPVSNGDKIAFLLAEKPVDFIRFDDSPPYSSNWNNATIKAWLNTDFLKQKLGGVASAIVTSKYKLGGYYTADYFDPDTNESTAFNSETGAESKIFLLSYQEANNTGYFSGEADRDMGYEFWLRSPGLSSIDAAVVYSGGGVTIYGSDVPNALAVRPAFKINLSSPIFTTRSIVQKDG